MLGAPQPRNLEKSACMPDVYMQIGIVSMFMCAFLALRNKFIIIDSELKNISLVLAK